MKLAVTTTEKKKTVTDAPEAQAQVQGAAITGSAAPSAEQQKTSSRSSLLQQLGYKPMSSSTTYPMPRPTTQQTTPETSAASSGSAAPSAEKQKTSPWSSLLQQLGYKPTSSSTYPAAQQTTQQTTPETPAASSGAEAQTGNATGVGTSQVTGQTQDTAAGSTTGTTTTTKVTYTPPEFKEAEYAPDFKPVLDDWLAAAREQQEKSIDYATNQGVAELQRAQEDAKQAYQTQRNQVATAEQRALDNQALYAESRGDRGGIGAAQYAAIQNTAAINTLAVNQQQTKLATDTARQIADLRARGEYQKADALLTLTQNYLSQLLSLKQWALSFNLSVDEFNNSLKQWALSYEMEVAQLTGTYQGEPTYAAQQDQLNRLSQSGYALLQAGVLPSQEQLDAMGMTQQEAYYWMQANGFMQIYGLEGTPFETTLRGAFGGRLGGIFGGGSGGSGGGGLPSGSSGRRSSSGPGGGGLPSGSSGGALSSIPANKATPFTGTTPSTSRTSFSSSPDGGVYTYAGKAYNSMDAVKNAVNNANLSDSEFATVKRKAESQTGVKWK